MSENSPTPRGGFEGQAGGSTRRSGFLDSSGSTPGLSDASAGPVSGEPATGGPRRLCDAVERVLRGKRDVVEDLVIACLAGGHVLIEDVPGTGKTTLARAFAAAVKASFRRIQFTSDLLPSDVVGLSVWSPTEETFRFQPGPVFTQVVLADELNRTPPRTQSGLLECMESGQISLDGVTRELPSPFFVIATQNPLEFEGTYSLPESQLDRFLFRLRMGYPDRASELEILAARERSDPIEGLEPVASVPELLAWRGAAREVTCEAAIHEYVLDLTEATRSQQHVVCGASPRASLGLVRAAKARALLEGRAYVVPDDVKRCAVQVLSHRLLFEDVAESDQAEGVIEGLLDTVPVRI